MTERTIGQVLERAFGTLVIIGYRLAHRVDHFVAALPIVDGYRTVGIANDEIDGAGNQQFFIVDLPLGTVRHEVAMVTMESQEMADFGTGADGGGTVVVKIFDVLVQGRASAG